MKKKRKKKKIVLIFLFILIVIVVSLIVFKFFIKSEGTSNIKVLDSIDNFNYTLDDRDTKLMKDTYNELKSILNESEIDYEEYAKLLSELFVIDLFTLDNKINKYDVGSSEYVYPESLENFRLNVEDTLYKSILDNSDNKRKQDLPIVSSIEVVDCSSDTYTIDENNYDSYVVSLKWSYVKDLGYDEEATITLIPHDNKLYVVKYEVGEE